MLLFRGGSGCGGSAMIFLVCAHIARTSLTMTNIDGIIMMLMTQSYTRSSWNYLLRHRIVQSGAQKKRVKPAGGGCVCSNAVVHATSAQHLLQHLLQHQRTACMGRCIHRLPHLLLKKMLATIAFRTLPGGGTSTLHSSRFSTKRQSALR